MKRHTKIAIAAAAAVIGLGALGSAVVAKGQGWHPGYGMYHTNMMGGMQGQGMYGQGMHRQGMMGGMGNRFQMMEDKFESHDLDGNGEVTQTEINQVHMDRLKAADANQDGQLDLEEFQTHWLQSKRNRMVDRFQAFDEDGNGQITEDEFASPMGRMIERHDLDGDGKVTMKELKKHARGWGPGRYMDNDDDDDRKRDKD